eukprot:g17755.t1
MRGFKLEDATFEPDALRALKPGGKGLRLFETQIETMGRSASRSRDNQSGGGGGGGGGGGNSKREKGTINTWNTERQFGFVSCDSGRQDLFTHAEYIADTNARYDAKTRGLRRGDRTDGNKKSMQAVNVEIIDLVKRSRSPSRRRSRSRGGRGRGGGGGGRSRSRKNTRPQEMRAGDWECPKCGDYQFARTPKPSSDFPMPGSSTN